MTMGTLKLILIAFLFTNLCAMQELQAADLFRQQSKVDDAAERYGVSGKNVIIAILDRGIEWQNPDFINPDGTTRIKWLLDMSGQNWCLPPKPPAKEYSAADINAALKMNGTLERPQILGFRDAVGHGTVTAGIAAGNGSLSVDGSHHGVAPNADLIIVKLTSEGAQSHGDQLAEDDFNGCISDALDWLDKKVAETHGEPVVAIINSGVQLWGPNDGTSVVSRKIDALFANQPGRIFVAPSGDEGGLLTHAGGDYENDTTVINLSRSKETRTDLAMWFKGKSTPVSITVEFDDDPHKLVARTDVPQSCDSDNGFCLAVFRPGQELDPRTSASGDNFVNLQVAEHVGKGRITLKRLTTGAGHFDMYSDLYWDSYGDPQAVTTFADHVVHGRLTDYASTRSAIVIGAYVSSNTWTDIEVNPHNIPEDVLDLWKGSAGGPTRDGRHQGVDVVAPGENVFATYALNSEWSTFLYNLVRDGRGHYGLQRATSGAAPIAVGAIALMLEMKPDLTSDQVRDLLRKTASHDGITEPIPNDNWGYGRINVRAALDQLCSLYHSTNCPN
jgi:minor extracellular serine protease Vpr